MVRACSSIPNPSVTHMQSNSRHLLILPVYVPALILAFCRGMLVPILPLYARSFDVSYGLVGLVLAAEGLGTLAADIPAGVLLRRIGRKRAMLLGIGCVVLSALALSWTRAFPELILYRFVAGIGGALWNISRHTYIADVVPVHQRGRAIAVFGGISRIGMFAGPAIGGAIGAAYGFRIPFLLYAGLAAVALLVSVRFIVESSTAAYRESRAKGHLLDVLKHHYRRLLAAGSGQLFAQMIRAGRRAIIPLYAADVIGLDLQSIGWIISISGAIDMSMFYPAGMIMDRFGRKYASVPSFLVQSIAMGLIPFSHSFLGLLLTTSLLGLGNGIGSGTMMTLGADLAPRESMGEFLGIWRLIGDSGNTGGPLVVGGIADLLGLAVAPFFIAGIGLLAASTFALFVPETLKNRRA